jgi:hypothetical protein
MMDNHIFTKTELVKILINVCGKTLGQVDKNGVFHKTINNPKITGIAGDVIEQSVIGYLPDNKQKPDLIVDNVKTELKTTGLKRIRKSVDIGHTIEAKEPMSITAVSPNQIVNEVFNSSNLWHKLDHMLLVYYLYDSDKTVTASEYANFPIQDYQFHEFNEQDRKIIENDWIIVKEFIMHLKNTLEDPTIEYPKISKLREKMMYMDTAPKYPNPPRFRLKRHVVSTIAQEHFGNGFEILEKQKQFTSYNELDNILHLFTKRYQGKSVEEIAIIIKLSLNRNSNGVVDKKINEQILTSAFGVKTGKLRNIDTFAKIGTIPKTLTLTAKGGRTEDTKFDTIDFSEWGDKTISFEESSLYDYFANQSLLFSIFEEVSQGSTLEKNVFRGFKRLYFDEDFIDEHVRKVWDSVRNLLFTNAFRVTKVLDKDGNVVVNKKTKTIREETNFPKSKDNVIFLRGTGQDSTKKTLSLNGQQIYQQQYWIKGSFLVDMLSKIEYI